MKLIANLFINFLPENAAFRYGPPAIVQGKNRPHHPKTKSNWNQLNKNKDSKMKITPQKKAQVRGFTLIEMIGVLAVIAILSALLIPKIFEAINNARVNNACVSLGTVKTAMADHYAKFGAIAYNGATSLPLTPPTDDFDNVLLSEGWLDKVLEAKISDNTGTMVRLRTKNAVSATAPTAPFTGADDPYNLDGIAAPSVNDTVAAIVCEAILTGVTVADARELSLRLDGANLSEADTTTPDARGRVKYDSAANPTSVLVYITHR
jgi:prepilin-type N-terminal cleavage/methylation domain-containing protein